MTASFDEISQEWLIRFLEHRIGAGRSLVVLKAANSSISEFGKLDLKLRVVSGTGRIVSTMAYEAGGAARASLRGYPRIGRFLPISYDVGRC